MIGVALTAADEKPWLISNDAELYTTLEEMLRGLQRKSPASSLGLGVGASESDARAAFLAATKQFHPARYARRDPHIVKLANEIFLHLKDAYEALKVELARGTGAQAKRSSSPPGARRGSDTRRSGSVAVPRVAGARRSGPVSVPKATSPRRSGPVAVPRASTARRSGPVAVPKGTPAEGSGASRKSGPAPTQVSFRGTGAVPVPGQGANTRRPRATPGHEDHAAKKAREDQQFAAAKNLLAQGKNGAARQAFYALAAANPNDRNYRIHLHYAWGHEHRDAGDAEKAKAEYQRALGIDPQFAPAEEALRSLGGKGLFSKLFRK